MAYNAENFRSANHLEAGFAHDKMVDDILAGIESGRLKPGDRIASEMELARVYSISVTSVRRGLGMLSQRGVLIRRRGSGAFIADTAQTRPSVKRNTVIVAEPWIHLTYHPYFSERLNGLGKTLREAGLYVEFVDKISGKEKPDSERNHRHQEITPDWLNEEIARRPEIAGVMAPDRVLHQIPQELRKNLAMASLGSTDEFSYANYNDKEDMERLFRAAMSLPASRFCIASTISPETLVPLWNQAKCARSADAADAQARWLHIKSDKTQSVLIHNAYQAVKELLNSEQEPFDAMIATDDFEALGIIDALREHLADLPESFTLFCFSNKTRPLQAPFKTACLEADGFVAGNLLAKILLQQLTGNVRRPEQFTLSRNWHIS